MRWKLSNGQLNEWAFAIQDEREIEVIPGTGRLLAFHSDYWRTYNFDADSYWLGVGAGIVGFAWGHADVDTFFTTLDQAQQIRGFLEDCFGDPTIENALALFDYMQGLREDRQPKDGAQVGQPQPMVAGISVGWVCPLCSRGLAPSVASCPWCDPNIPTDQPVEAAIE